jgi:hypothetical protein
MDRSMSKPLNPAPAAGAPASAVRPRPAFLRALGRAEPPQRVLVAARRYRLERVFKHDSWAATALYRLEPGEPDGEELLVCKFNRQESVFGLPLAWLGPVLAAREARFLARLAGTGRVPAVERLVLNGQGRRLDHAVAHAFVTGEPLSKRAELQNAFFPCLEQLLAAMHADGLAYVDLHKMENVLVGSDGLPWLIDFQVSFALPRRQPWRALARPLFNLLSSGDRYHLIKHWIRLRPDQCGLGPADLDRFRPRWIRWHRRIGVPLRSLRRRLLTGLGVRDRSGHARSETFAEEALRQR